MENLLIVLLFLGAICSPCEYSSQEIYMIEASRQSEVDAVENDQDLMDSIRVVFGQAADEVSITDIDEEY